MVLDRGHLSVVDISNAGGVGSEDLQLVALNAMLDELDYWIKNSFTDKSTITLGTPAGTTQTATIQLKDRDGTNIAAAQKIRAYMCTDSAGATPSSTGVSTSVTVSTGTSLKVNTAKLDLDVITNTSGVAVLTFSNGGTGASTYTNRVVLVLPNGKLVVSAALAVAGP